MDDLYDEFGNYIGPDLESDEEEDVYGNELTGPRRLDMNEDKEEEEEPERMEEEERDEVTSTAVVLHEDKKYYPTAEELYGAGVEVSS